MGTLTIRNLPREVHARLRVRAAERGRSMEAEARAILAEAVADRGDASWLSLQDWVDSLYGAAKPRGVVDELIAERRRESANE